MKKAKSAIRIIVLILAVLASFMHIPIEYNKSFKCIQIEYESDKKAKVNNVNVQVEGTIHKSLLRQDFARLQLIIDGKKYPDTERYSNIFSSLFKGQIISDGQPNFEIIDYFDSYIYKWDNNYYTLYMDIENVKDYETQEVERAHYGTVYFLNSIEEIVIKMPSDITKGGWSMGEGNSNIISGETIEEAALTLEKFNFDSNNLLQLEVE